MNVKELSRRYELVAWGALFVWIGATDLVPGLPEGTGWLGVAIILLGLNLLRYLSNIPTGIISMAVGIIALILGAAKLLQFHFTLPLFETGLIVIGVILLIRSVAPIKTE